MKAQRGIYERFPGSNVWWVRYADSAGRIRREKAGVKSATIKLYQKRKTEVLAGKKLPENLRVKPVIFTELAADTLAYSRARKRSYMDDKCRMAEIRKDFGSFVAELITPKDIDSWLDSHDRWAVATKNRYLALIKLSYRLAERNGRIKVNPSRLVRMRKENNQRVRYLNQHDPMPTSLAYLKNCHDEE